MNLEIVDRTWLEVKCNACGFEGRNVPVLNVYMRCPDDPKHKTVHNVCPRCLMLDELEFIRHEHPKRYVGVIAKSTDDFLEWRKEQNHQPLLPHTKKKYVIDNTTYFCLSHPTHCVSMQFDEIVETSNATQNAEYEKIRQYSQYCLKRKE